MRTAAAILFPLLLAVAAPLMWPGTATATTLRGGTPTGTVTVVVDEARPGEADLTIRLTARDGTPVTGAFVQVQAIMPLLGYATPEVAATAAGGGRYTVTGIRLMSTGPWELRLRLPAADLVLPFRPDRGLSSLRGRRR